MHIDPMSEKSTELFDLSVSLLAWGYNEEENILPFLERAVATLDTSVREYEIILVDDGSTDRTYELALDFQKRHPVVKVLKNDRNRNVAYSFRHALSTASKEIVFWQTVDWSYDLGNLHAKLAYLKTYDIVQGARRGMLLKKRFWIPSFFTRVIRLFGIEHFSNRSDNRFKALVSITNYVLIRLLFRVPLSDFQNVSFYRTQWLKTIAPTSDSAFGNPEMLIKSFWSGKTIKEVPMNFIPRQRGKAKGVNLRSVTGAIRDIFGFWIRWQLTSPPGTKKKGRIDRVTDAAVREARMLPSQSKVYGMDSTV
jgi:glycosyltransferase involved in cell wall biosynthesis